MTKLIYPAFFTMLVVLQAGCSSSGGGGDDDPETNNPPANNGGSTGSTDGGDSSGGSDSGSTTTRNVSKIGAIGVVEDKEENLVDAFGSFIGYEETFEIPESAENPYLALKDSCEITSSDDDGDIDIPEPEEDVESIFLDAGAVVSIKSNGQNYLELQRVDLSQDISFYATGGSDKTPPIPSGLTVTIPGAQFPAFTDVPFIDVGGFALTAPGQGSAIRFDTVFTWQPIDTNNPNIIVEISASSFNTTVSCVTSDSGSFAFPEETQNELGTGFFANELSASRIGYHVRFKDDAALVVYSLSQ